ncbi:MAG: quinolinate synthase NadA [Solirubrobacterales bacterium]
MNNNYREKILNLKKEKNALILAHYYQRPEIQDIADLVGDSYYLSQAAKDREEKLVVFCGVKFMAESAKILSPQKTILLPVNEAGCPMADMAEPHELEKLKMEHPDALTVCYINSTTEVKAHCDVSVTSSSAENIFGNIKERKIIFLPDRNLGRYLAKKFPDKEFILWNGFCVTHTRVAVEDVLELKASYPDAEVLVHPECEEEICSLADFIGSTGDILKYSTNSNSTNFIVVTEEGILHKMKKQNPDKNFYVPGGSMVCSNMKKTTLKDVYESLLYNQNEIEIEENLRRSAEKSLLNMHKLAGK